VFHVLSRLRKEVKTVRKYLIMTTALLIVIAIAFALNVKQDSGSTLAQEKNIKPVQDKDLTQAMTQEDLKVQHDAELEGRLDLEKKRAPKSYLGTAGRVGYILLRVDAEGPAQKAGLKAGDIILFVNDIQIDSIDDMRRVTQLSPGEEVKISFIRPSEGGFLPDAERSVTARLAEYEWTDTRKKVFEAQKQ
jgi:predicted metalloprotease with PDZ domain